MHEDILAPFLLNEAESLGVIEPLHLSFGHRPSPAHGTPPSARGGGTSQEGLRRLYRSEVIFCQDKAMQITICARILTVDHCDCRCRTSFSKSDWLDGERRRWPTLPCVTNISRRLY